MLTMGFFPLNQLIIIFISLLILQVKAEGYLCPYREMGYDGKNSLLYDYYDTSSSGTYWTKKGETGWQSVEEYCKQKGDLFLHEDAGEWKCNDSHGLCKWTGTSCSSVTSRKPDCKRLCNAILKNQGVNCLGDCPNGHQTNTLYTVCRNKK